MSNYQETFQLPFELTNGNDGRVDNSLAGLFRLIYNLAEMRNPPIKKGQVFGKWTAISEEGKNTQCVCECGTKRVVASKTLWRKSSTSCGCVRSKKIASRNRKIVDGLESTNHDLYETWKSMKKRCLNKNCSSYKNYGGRGISVCKSWSNSFAEFAKDMGKRPSGASIERIDNSKGYSPDNCKWSDFFEQANNRRSCRYITNNGITKTQAQWSSSLGGNKTLVYNRIRRGWSEIDAVTKPLRGHE